MRRAILSPQQHEVMAGKVERRILLLCAAAYMAIQTALGTGENGDIQFAHFTDFHRQRPVPEVATEMPPSTPWVSPRGEMTIIEVSNEETPPIIESAGE